MKDKSAKEYIGQNLFDGKYGEYLINPISPKQRAAEVGKRMLFCRKQSDMSQTEVCSIIGIAPQTYSGYENGRHEPALETIVRLSYLYGVTIDYLLGKNTENNPIQVHAEEQTRLKESDAFSDIQLQIDMLKQEIDELRQKIEK